MNLGSESVRRVSGFGGWTRSDSYVVRPSDIGEVPGVLASRRKIALRGAGQSYGDAAILAEEIVLDLSGCARILDWDSETGQITVESGVTLEQIWRHTLPAGWWPSVVTGTMRITVGGAISMNVHGKNHFAAGSFAEHVLAMDVLFPNGEQRTLTPEDELFWQVAGSAGLLGVILSAKLQLHRSPSGMLRVVEEKTLTWAAALESCDRLARSQHYSVGWIDLFSARGGQVHGVLHGADPIERDDPARRQNQDLPTRVMGIPKSVIWRALKLFNRPMGMRLINAAKFAATRCHTIEQSLVQFSFLLDYVPNWQRAYDPGGFLQFQPFVPADRAEAVFQRLATMQHEAGHIAMLGVLKRHQPMRGLFAYTLDGFSLAMDFRFEPGVRELCERMQEVVLEAGGRFYFAKDSTLTRDQAHRMLGPEKLAELRRLRQEFDPDGVLTTALGVRLGLQE